MDNYKQMSTIDFLLTLLSFCGLSISSDFPILYRATLSVLIFVVYSYYIFIRRKKHVRIFEIDSSTFVCFFSKWYSEEGELHVYCNDLRWVNNQQIKDALHLKAIGHRLHLYLKTICSNARDFESHGAKVYQIPEMVQSSHKFSIIKSDGFERIICRKKVIESDNSGTKIIEFIETNNREDSYLVDFAKDILTKCKLNT